MKEGQRRKIARISACEVAIKNKKYKKQEQSKGSNKHLGHRKKGPKRKSLEQVMKNFVRPEAQQDAEKQGSESQKHEDPPIGSNDREENHSSLPLIPDKHILEFVLDVLQRTDKKGFFSQPVDPNEVEHYYEFIKEPMDFGTIRARLKDDIYKTLDQFQHDVYQVMKNAMFFNASTTIYYKKAVAINKLAKRVFNKLKSDPEGIREEFTARNPHSKKDLRNGTDLNCYERRQTYKLGTSSWSENKSIVSSVSNNCKELVSFNEGIGYIESLQRFVKDLGPIAQKVAFQKLAAIPNDQSRIPRDDISTTKENDRFHGRGYSHDHSGSGKQKIFYKAYTNGGASEKMSTHTGNGINTDGDTHASGSSLGNYSKIDSNGQSASGSRSNFFDTLPRSYQSPNSIVYPSQIVKPSDMHLATTLQHGLGSHPRNEFHQANDWYLNFGVGSTQVREPAEQSCPNPTQLEQQAKNELSPQLNANNFVHPFSSLESQFGGFIPSGQKTFYQQPAPGPKAPQVGGLSQSFQQQSFLLPPGPNMQPKRCDIRQFGLGEMLNQQVNIVANPYVQSKPSSSYSLGKETQQVAWPPHGTMFGTGSNQQSQQAGTRPSRFQLEYLRDTDKVGTKRPPGV